MSNARDVMKPIVPSGDLLLNYLPLVRGQESFSIREVGLELRFSLCSALSLDSSFVGCINDARLCGASGEERVESRSKLFECAIVKVKRT